MCFLSSASPCAQGDSTGCIQLPCEGGVLVLCLGSSSKAAILCQHTGERISCAWVTAAPSCFQSLERMLPTLLDPPDLSMPQGILKKERKKKKKQISLSHVLISCSGMLCYLKSWFLWHMNLKNICVNARKCLLLTEVLCPLPCSPCLGPAQVLSRQPFPPGSSSCAAWSAGLGSFVCTDLLRGPAGCLPRLFGLAFFQLVD